MATTTIHGRDAVAGYRALFDRLAAGRRNEPAWLRAAREAAMQALEGRGLPTTRDEDWRFTNVSPLTSRAFEPVAISGTSAAAGVARQSVIPGLPGPVLVFVDGRFAAGLSRMGTLPAGVQAGSLASVLENPPEWMEGALARDPSPAARPFGALNTALFEDGAYVFIAPGVVVDGAVQVVFVSSGTRATGSIQARAVVFAGENSQVRVVETFAGLGGSRSFTNAVTEIASAEGSVVDHYRLQREADTSFHVGLTRLEIGRSSSISSLSVAMGGTLARHDAIARLGLGADCTLNGLYLADGEQLVDNHTEIEHAMPNGTSHEVYKGILGGRARGVFNGRIKVRPDAQKTDAKQTNKTLLLSDEAQINTKPQLEIFANDVKCTHGATVGQLSADALFYLRARGIGADEARALLIRAFAADVVSKVRLEPVREDLDRLLSERLPGARAEKMVA